MTGAQMSDLFDAQETQGLYIEALQLVDDLRNELYSLQDAGQSVDDLIDRLFELEEELLVRSE